MCISVVMTKLVPVYLVMTSISSYDHVYPSDEGPMLETLDFTIRIGSTPTFLYFDLYLHSVNAAHYVYLSFYMLYQ